MGNSSVARLYRLFRRFFAATRGAACKLSLMRNRIIAEHILSGIRNHGAKPWFPVWLGLVSLGLTVSAAFPFGLVLVAAALAAPARWLSLTLLTSLGAALGSTILLAVFSQLGWEQIAARFPEFASTAAYRWVSAWAGELGLVALFLVAVTPVPQTASVALCALGQPPLLPSFFALWAGKFIRYGFYALLAARSPQKARAWAMKYGLWKPETPRL